MTWKRTDMLDATLILVIVAALLWLLCSTACGEVVTRVIDGDSLVLDDGRQVQLLGIEAPAIGTQGGDAARRLLVMYALDRDVRVEVSDTAWGATIAKLTWRQWDLGKSMVAAGRAFARGGHYVNEERAARAARKGLWSQDVTELSEWHPGSRADAVSVASSASVPVPVYQPARVFHLPTASPKLTIYRNTNPVICVGNT